MEISATECISGCFNQKALVWANHYRMNVTFVQSAEHGAKILMELMRLTFVSNAMLAKIIRKRLKKLALLTAKLG